MSPTEIPGFTRRNSGWVALAISGVLALAYLIWAPQTLDLAAQTFRSDLWADHGFVIWNPDWYFGHSIPGYSLLLPPLGALLGPVLLGALSAVAATALFASIAWRAYGERAWLGVIWFGVASMAAPFAGRTAFALGLAIGLGCVWAIQRERPALAATTGALAAWASPVAGAFVLVACATVLLAGLGGRMPALAQRLLGAASFDRAVRAAVAAAAATATAVALLVLAFPTPGWQPFTLSSWLWIPVVTAVLLALVPPREGEPAGNSAIRWGALVYLLVSLAALLLQTPMGGNAARLGATLAGPLFAILLVRPEAPWRPRLALLLVAGPLLWWCWTATVRDVAAAGNAGTEKAYYEPLLGLLAEQNVGLEPLRVVPTRSRWESVYVAEQRPITGGWLRQLESPDFDFLEQDLIAAGDYRRWLAERGISLVAISDAQPDWLAHSEADLLRSGAFDSERSGTAGEWELYRFGGQGSFVLDGEARLLELEPDAFELELGSEETLLSLGWSPYFEVVSGAVCIESAEGPGGRDVTRVIPAAGDGVGETGPQTVRVEARFSLAGVLGRDRDCGDAEGG